MTDIQTEMPPEVKEKKIPVVEVFGPTIQGEGLVAGQRTVFIRFGLCDYKCTMCDSMHAVDPRQVKENARWMTQYELAEEVLAKLAASNCSNVTYSGGNPCIHDLWNLTECLTEAGVSIALETQGTKFPEWVYSCDWITVSPKGPGMGEIFEPDKFKVWINALLHEPHFCVKVVIFSARDLEFASDVARMCKQLLTEDRFYLSVGNPYPPGQETPDHSVTTMRRIIQENTELILADLQGFPALKRARILPQVHTLLWGSDKGR